jgi:hypothetical protein
MSFIFYCKNTGKTYLLSSDSKNKSFCEDRNGKKTYFVGTLNFMKKSWLKSNLYIFMGKL